MSSKQISFICLDQLVSEKHQYRKFKELFDFEVASQELKAVESGANYKGYGILRLFIVSAVTVYGRFVRS